MLGNIAERAAGWALAGGIGLIVGGVVKPMAEAWLLTKGAKRGGEAIDECGEAVVRLIRAGAILASTTGKTVLVSYATLVVAEKVIRSSIDLVSDVTPMKLLVQGVVTGACVAMTGGILYKAHQLFFSSRAVSNSSEENGDTNWRQNIETCCAIRDRVRQKRVN